MIAASAPAATYYWDGSADVTLGSSDNTNTGAQNWLSGGLWDNGTTSAALASWTAGDSAVFGGSAATQTITAGTFTIGNLTFGGGAAGTGTTGTAYTISGGTLTLSSSVITTNTATTIGSILAGSSALTKSGTGSLTLSGVSTYSGGTTISAGAIYVTTSASALGSGAVTLGDANTGTNATGLYLKGSGLTLARNITVSSQGSGTVTIGGTALGSAVTAGYSGTLALNRAVTLYNGDATADKLTFSGVISGTADITVDGVSGTNNSRVSFIQSSNNTFVGNVSVTGTARFQLGAGSGAADLVYDGAVLTVASGGKFVMAKGGQNETIGALSGAGTVEAAWGNDTLTVGGNNQTGSFSGTIIQTGVTLALTKIGSGTQTLSGASTYAGATLIKAGTLVLSGGTNRISASSAVTLGDVATSGKLVLGNASATATQTINTLATTGLGGSIVGGNASNSTLYLNLASNTTFSGLLGGTGTNEKNLIVIKQGAGSLTLSATGSSIAQLSADVGTLAITGGTLAVSGMFGPSDWGTARTATVNQSGGTVTLGAGANYYGSRSNNQAIAYNLSGGTFDASAASFWLGWDVGATSPTFTVSAGELKVAGINQANTSTGTTGGTLVLTGGKITVGSAGIGYNKNIYNVLNFGGGIVASSAAFSSAAGQAITLTGTNGSTTFDTAGGNITLNGVLSGATGGLIKVGANTLALAGANTFAGGISVQNGTLSVTGASGTIASQSLSIGSGSNSGVFVLGDASNAKSLTVSSLNTSGTGTGNAIVGGGNASNSTLTVNTTTSDAFGGVIGGAGSNQNALALVKQGVGTLTLSGANTYAGGTTVSAGTLAGNATSLQGAITNNATVNFNQGTSGTYAGLMSGTGSVSKTGAGTLTLSNASNSFSGGSSVTAGTLSFASGALGSSGAITVNGGTLQWATGNTEDVSSRLTLVSSGSATLDTNGNNVNLATAFGGSTSSSVTKVGSGTLTFSGANTYTGGTTVTAGTLAGDSASLLGAITNNATVNFNQSSAGTYAGVMTGTGLLTKTGNGTLTLSGANTHTGGTTVSAGTLAFANGTLGSSGAITVNGGTLQWATGNTQDISSRLTLVSSGSATLDTNGNNVTLASAFGGSTSSSLTKAGNGTLTLSAASTHTGGTTVSAGTLALASAGSVGSVNVASGANLSGTGTAGAATISSGGTILPGLAGAGTLTLSSLTFGGSATIGVGFSGASLGSLLKVNGDVTANGGASSVTFSLGSNLALLAAGDYDLLLYSGAALADASAFTYTGTKGGRQDVTIANVTALTGGYRSLQLHVANAFPVWTGVQGSSWAYLDGNWKLNTDNSTTDFRSTDTVYFQDDASTGVVDLSADVDPSSMIFSADTLDYTVGSSGGYKVTSGSLVKSGAAKLTLTSANTFGGGTSLTGGVLRIGNNGALGSGTLTLGGGKLTSDGTAARSLSNAVLVTGAVTLGDATDNGALTLSGGVDLGAATRTLTVASDVTLSGVVSNGGLSKSGNGKLTLSGANTYSGDTTVSSGTLEVSGTLGLGTYAGAIGVDGSLVVSTASAQTISGAITGAGSLTKSGNGTLTLTGANGYSGGTTVSAGTLVGNSGSIQGSVTNNAAVTFNQASAGTYAGVISGTGSVTKTGNGALTFSGANSYSGGTTVSAGTLVGDTTSLQGSIVDNAAVTFNQASAGTYAGAISGTGSLGKDGAGVLTLTGSNTFSGGITISAGTLELGGSGTLGSGAYAGAISNSAALLVSTASAQTLSGAITGAGSLTKSGNGTLTLTGANGYSGGTTVSAGTLAGDSTSLQGAITNNATVNFNQASAGTYAGLMSGTGLLNKTGNGALTLSNASNSYSGGTFIRSGTLAFASGALGSTGSISVNGGALQWASGNTQDISSRLVLANSGSATLDTGSNSVTLASAFGGSTSSSLTKAGAGALTISGANTYTGGTVIASGSIIATNANALGGSGTVTLGAAGTGSANVSLLLGNITLGQAISVSSQGTGSVTLGANGSVANPEFSGLITLGRDVILDGSTNTDRMTFTGGIGGTGNVTIAGSQRVLFLSSANTFSGNVTVNSGSTLQLDYGTSTTTSYIPDAAVVTVNGTLKLAKGNNSETIGGLAGSGSVYGHDALANIASAIVINGNTSNTFSGVLSNGGATGATLSLTMAGTGTQTLSGTNTYTGGTVISSGTLVAASASALGTGTITINDAATGSGAATLLLKGETTFARAITVANVGTGTVTIGASSIKVGSQYAMAVFSGGISLGRATTFYNGDVASDNLRFTGVISGAGDITVDGVAGATLGGGNTRVNFNQGSNNTFTGNVTVTGTGRLQIGAGSGAADLIYDNALVTVATGGKFVLAKGGQNETIGALSGAGTVSSAWGNDTLTLGSGNLSGNFSGSLQQDADSLKIIKVGTGTQVLSGASSYTGGTTLSAGTLAVGNNGALGSGGLTVNGSSTLRSADGNVRTLANSLTFSSDATLGDATNNGALTFGGTTSLGSGTRTLAIASAVTLNGVVSGAGLTKTGNGTLTLGGVGHTYTGDTTVSAGTLALASGATLASNKLILASGTSLQAAAGYTLGSGKTLQLGLSGVASTSMLGDFALSGGSLNLDIGSGTQDVLAVTGNLNLASGTVNFSPVGGSYASGTYGVITYTGSLSGSIGNLTTTGLSAGGNSRAAFELSSATAGIINLIVSGSSASLAWTGATNATWDAGSSGQANWLASGTVTAGASDKFYDLDSVTFDDTGANRSVAVDSSLNVGAITLANATTDYSFSGSGSIGGVAAIAKSGAGLVTLGVGYTGTGGLSVSNGTLRLTSSGFAPGVGATVAVSGGRLELASGVSLGATDTTVTGGVLSVVESASLGSGALTVNGGTLELAAAGSYTRSLTVGAGGAAINATGSGTTTYTSAVNLAGALSLGASSGSTLVASGALSGSGALTKTGNGTLQLAAAATYTGSTTVSAGTLEVASTLGTSAAYAGAISLSGGISFTSASNQTLSGAITGAGSLSKSGGGTLTLSNANTGYSGAVSVGTGSTLYLGNVAGAGTGTVTLVGGTLSHNVANVTIANNIEVGVGGGTLMGRQTVDSYTNFSGAISGSANLTVDGLVRLSGSASGFTGRYVLNDASSYLRLGTNSVNANTVIELPTGYVRVDGSISGSTYAIGGLSSTQTGAVFATGDAGHNATLDIAGSGNTTYGGVLNKNLTNNFVLSHSGSGTQVLNRASGNGEYLASVSVSGGVLELAGASVAFDGGYFGGSQSYAVTNGGTLRVSQDWNLASTNTVTVTGGTLDVTATSYLNNLVLGGGASVTGGLRVAGTANGTITASGDVANVITAGLSLVSNGALRIATVSVADGAAADDLTISGAVTDLSGYAGTALAKTGAGTLVLSAANSFTGGVNVTGGTVRIGSDTSLGSGAVSLSGASLDLDGHTIANSLGLGASGGTLVGAGTITNAISGTGSLTKSGDGVLVLNAANTYGGGTTVLGGTLRLVDVASLGSAGVTVSGGYLDLNYLNPTNTITLAGGELLNAGSWTPASINLAGPLSAAAINALPTATINVASGASLDLTGVSKDLIITGNASLDGLSGYSGVIELRAGGTMAVGAAGYDGNVTYKGGAVTGNFTGNLNVTGTNVALTSANLSGVNIVLETGNTVTIGAGLQGNISLQGGGVVGNDLNNLTGTVTVTANQLLDLGGHAGNFAISNTGMNIVVESGATLKGTASVGTITANAGSVIAPGNSPGSFQTESFKPLGGSAYDFEIRTIVDGVGIPGVAGFDYDTIAVSGELDLTALSVSSQLLLNLITLDMFNANGTADGWDPSVAFELTLYSYGTLKLNDGAALSDLFNINSDGFLDASLNPVFKGHFSVINDTLNNEIHLVYSTTAIPEPSTYGLMLGGLALAAAAYRRKRRKEQDSK